MSSTAFASVFQVPKNEEVDRAIINCKLINLGFAKPPPLSLAEIGTLLGLVKYFDDVCVCFFRDHWPMNSLLTELNRKQLTLNAKGQVKETFHFTFRVPRSTKGHPHPDHPDRETAIEP